MAPSILDDSLLGLVHPVFNFGEGLFDRIEVRGVGRQVPKLAPAATIIRLIEADLWLYHLRRIGRRKNDARPT